MPKATKADIEAFEREHGVPLNGYTDWLLKYDGGDVCNSTGFPAVQMYGVAHKPFIEVDDQIVIGRMSDGTPIELQDGVKVDGKNYKTIEEFITCVFQNTEQE